MSSSNSRIHPTAVISQNAQLADDVQVGAFAVIEGDARIGPGCVLRPYAHLIGPLVMGRDNQVFGGAILGERPQHFKYNDEPTRTEIGDGNVFREQVTVHRGTSHAQVTRIGSGNYFMVNSHVAHDCVIGNRCILANGALLAGHCVCGDNVYLSGNCAVHQFVQLGRLCMLSGLASTAQDVPPFAIVQGRNCIIGVNVVGMRRAGLSSAQINAVRRAYHGLFFERTPLPAAMTRVESELGTVDVVQEMMTFLRGSKRGVVTMRDRDHEAA